MSTLSLLGASYSTTSDTGAELGILAILLPVYLLVVVVSIVSLWKVFSKAGRPGWAALIPIYNIWVLLEVAGKPGWWSLAAIAVSFIPVAGSLIVLVVSLIVAIELAKKFGKSTIFGVIGLWLFSLIGYAMLAFGDARYEGEVSATATPTTPEVITNPTEGVASVSQDSTPPTPPTQ